MLCSSVIRCVPLSQEKPGSCVERPSRPGNKNWQRKLGLALGFAHGILSMGFAVSLEDMRACSDEPNSIAPKVLHVPQCFPALGLHWRDATSSFIDSLPYSIPLTVSVGSISCLPCARCTPCRKPRAMPHRDFGNAAGVRRQKELSWPREAPCRAIPRGICCVPFPVREPAGR